ncbi:hypothetical protein F7725_019846 [Dissostichus mawsoni]|uniref:Headcase middle domain-containing protein n=1 Tax=Dissostichus mawsoni TaxID=36200 RepID=A0A7J5YNV8_DISMA|nr:hypothetical protein F7725_019846 [Dissostichus mawsoni]
MPNQKNNKGKKSKRTNSSGDEQENGACAAATGGAAAAAAAPRHDRSSAGPAPSTWRRTTISAFSATASSALGELHPDPVQLHRPARSWNEKQCRQNMWTKKGYDLAFRFCSCRCGQGHLKKDTDWYQVKRSQEERKKKPSERSTGRNGSSGGASGDGLYEEPKRSKPLGAMGGGKLPHRASSQEFPRRASMDRQNSTERGSRRGTPSRRTLLPGASSEVSMRLPGAMLGAAGLRGSRQLGEFFKSAVHMDPQRKHLLVGALGRGGCSIGASGCGAHLDPGVIPLPLSFSLPLHQRLSSGSVGDGAHSHPVHASQRNVVNCALCHRALPVFEQFPLVDGTLFLSPSRHDEIEYDVPCHLQGRLMHLYAICVDCLEGVHKIVCIKCKSRWDGSWHQLGTMYTYDILAASPCCQARLNCKHCGKPVVDVRVGMQYFSEYSNVQQCPHCGNLDYHFVKPFSSYKVLEAY